MAAKTAAESGLRIALLERKKDISRVRRTDAGVIAINEYIYGQVATFNRATRTLVFPVAGFSLKYEGPWNVPFEVPTSLAAALSGNTFLRPVLLDSAQAAALGRHEREGRIALSRGLELAHATGADYVVFGQVETLAMERFRATVPAGGYRSYEGRTRVTLRPVKVIDQQPTAVVTREGVEATKQYGITNPAAFVPYEKEYFELSQMAWGSAAFQETLLGKSVADIDIATDAVPDRVTDVAELATRQLA